VTREEGRMSNDRHTILGWYWMEEGYENDGSCGPFTTQEAALRHARCNEAEEPYAVYLSEQDLM